MFRKISMLIPYSKRYIRFIRVEETDQTLIYAVLLEHNGWQEIALCEPRLVRIILKKDPLLTLPVGTQHQNPISKPILSPFTKTFFSTTTIPTFSYARPPTL